MVHNVVSDKVIFTDGKCSPSLSSMDVETTSPIHHLIFGGGIVRGCTVLCVIDTHGHMWDTDKRS